MNLTDWKVALQEHTTQCPEVFEAIMTWIPEDLPVLQCIADVRKSPIQGYTFTLLTEDNLVVVTLKEGTEGSKTVLIAEGSVHPLRNLVSVVPTVTADVSTAADRKKKYELALTFASQAGKTHLRLPDHHNDLKPTVTQQYQQLASQLFQRLLKQGQ